MPCPLDKVYGFILLLPGTSVTQVIAEDADDEMFGMAAKLVYSISQGHPYFSVEPATGQCHFIPISQTGNVNTGSQAEAGITAQAHRVFLFILFIYFFLPQ